MKDFFNLIFPPDVPAIVRWRVIIALLLCAVMINIVWAAGGLSSLGLGEGFARKEYVDHRINETTSPIQGALNDSKMVMSKIVMQLNQSLENSKASEIRGLASKRCIVKGDEKERLNREIDVKEQEYYDLRNQYYTIPECSDLR